MDQSYAVIDRLEVGPPRVERRRIVTPYRVVRGGDDRVLDLIYRYEEDVLDPDDPYAHNLAAVIGAQVALNYGLFCREILFHGIFDDDDRRFLDGMMRCTGREIFVKKLLEPNQFLTRDAPGPVARTRAPFLNARLRFDGKKGGGRAGWSVNPESYCVLLSGGKESLLSFGLLRELKKDVHPLFVNESGRHWYTALNSYRYFRENFPATVRVWTNADRLFTFMLRHLPFIRSDFLRLQSDDYPIRLWTVAVFVFGALPIMNKRGAGILVVGDEHDTSRIVRRDGFIHFDGLYDQSVFFDRAMSRYCAAKGWGVRQVSLLRMLSEIVILRILTDRYPDIQINQISCHMAHISGDRVYPCGRCEKCHRIVGMLKAVGADPARIGYSGEQIKACMKNLPRRSIHQEEAAALHMLHLLAGRGALDGGIETVPHPEIEKIRIDPLTSPVEELPPPIREDLLEIFRAYTTGTVVRRGRLWEE